MNNFASFFPRKPNGGCIPSRMLLSCQCTLCDLAINAGVLHYRELGNPNVDGRIACEFCYNLFVLPNGLLAPPTGTHDSDKEYAALIREMQSSEQQAIRAYLLTQSFDFLNEFKIRYPQILDALRIAVCPNCNAFMVK